METPLFTQAAILLILGCLSVWIYLYQRRKSRLPPGVEYPPHRYSWIPWLGHALDMSSRPIKDFIEEQAKGDRLFTCTITGDRCLFLADTQLIPLIYKDRPELDFQHLERRFLTGVMGISEDYASLFQDKADKATRDLMHKHFLKRQALADRIHVAQGVLAQQVEGLSNNQEWSRRGLYELTCDMVFKATIASVVGDYLAQDCFLEDFRAFDKDFPILFSGQVPDVFTTKSRQARERLVEALMSEEYANTPQTPFIQDRAARAAAAGVPPEFYVRQYTSFLWVSVANSMPGIFWTLYHLLKDPVAYDKCREQVQAIVDQKETRFFFTLEELDQMTLLQSVFYETLRLKQVIYSARLVTADFVLNPKDDRAFLLEKGTRILACPTLVHHDAAIFENPATFQYDRFVGDHGKVLSDSMRAFGGGGHLCSGRKFISYETQAMLAMMLAQLDLRLVDAVEVGMDYSRQGIGVPPPTSDPLLEVRRKRREQHQG